VHALDFISRIVVSSVHVTRHLLNCRSIASHGSERVPMHVTRRYTFFVQRVAKIVYSSDGLEGV
jgi:hypothetical protein